MSTEIDKYLKSPDGIRYLQEHFKFMTGRDRALYNSIQEYNKTAAESDRIHIYWDSMRRKLTFDLRIAVESAMFTAFYVSK